MSQKKPKSQEKEVSALFPLGRENYKLMIIGLGIIVLGFILMIGGGSDDPNVFSEDIFSFRRITLAPIIVLFGFIFQIYAIMKRPKQEQEQ
jgi:fumarate reductase subunit D